jgi:Cdc6-like AAA superfamily ATPase
MGEENQFISPNIPCWDVDNIDKAIKRTAAIGKESLHYFMACHDPFQGLKYENNEEINEEQFFNAIFATQDNTNKLVIVRGDPGTGKSHLVHWLMRRCESHIENRGFEDTNLNKVFPVIIQRDESTLKSLLEQMIKQLSGDFEKHLQPIRDCIEKIGKTDVRIRLADHMFDELGDRWNQRNPKENIPRDIKDLKEIFKVPGSRDFLCRDGGVIDRFVKNLTENDFDAGGESIRFENADLNIPTDALLQQGDMTVNVKETLDEIDDDDDVKKDAIRILNQALEHAGKTLVGLGEGGRSLTQIFDDIRQELKSQGKTLVLMIEDVTPFGTINKEILQAVEPKEKDGLCRLIAVVGMTQSGYKELPANMIQRVTHNVLLERSDENWGNTDERINQFTARYLNAIRLSESDVRKISVKRLADFSKDITKSKCTKCEIRETCWDVFGKVEFGSVAVGMFPFNKIAPSRVINKVDPRKGSADYHGMTQRYWLNYILGPVLKQLGEEGGTGRFPNNKIRSLLSANDPDYWTTFENEYCGNWPKNDKDRLSLMATCWVDADSADEAASKLKDLIRPFYFQPFGREVVTLVTTPTPTPTDTTPPPEEESEELREIRLSLKSWFENENQKLQKDQACRKLLADLIRNSIDWENEQRIIPKHLVVEYFPKGRQNYNVIHIENQDSRASGSLITFSRNEETRNLIESLAFFKFKGKLSWNYDGSEIHKRIILSWLNKNKDGIIKQILREDESKDAVINKAVGTLYFDYCLNQRDSFPEKKSKRLEAIFSQKDVNENASVTENMKNLLPQLKDVRKDLQSFLINEFGLSQGDIGDSNNSFINPLLITKSLQSLPREITALDENIKSKNRYKELIKINRVTSVNRDIEEEVDRLGEIINEIEGILERWWEDETVDFSSMSDSQLNKMREKLCKDFEKLCVCIQRNNFHVHAPGFEDNECKLYDRSYKEELKNTFADLVKIQKNNESMKKMEVNPINIKKFYRILKSSNDFKKKAKSNYNIQLQNSNPIENMDGLVDQFYDSLKTFDSE